MQSIRPADAHTPGPPKVTETEEYLASLRQHLNDVLEGAAFKSSHRSGQFLKHIIEQAIAGHADELKERLIGVELFGRSPSYDTGDDPIVRVTASDVRRRLLQHYGTYGSGADFRITLPQGSYVPEITHSPSVPKERAALVALPGLKSSDALSHSPAATEQAGLTVEQHPAQDLSPAGAHAEKAQAKVSSHSRVWFGIGLALTVLNLIFAGSVFWMHHSAATRSPRSVLPWSIFFAPSHLTHIITSDPNMDEVQDICGHSVSVSDYANRNYIPDTTGLPLETLRICHALLSADNASSVDPGITARISALAQQASAPISVQTARNFDLANLKTDDDYILLGSPRSNPWSALFNDQLDFVFVYNKALHQELIRNLHAHGHELAEYVPTAMGGGTGKSFAIAAFLQNLDQNGHVLLLAGTNAEGTEAAGSFVTDVPRLSTALRNCGVSGAQSHFELLLQVDTMAGSPSNIRLVTCHALPSNSIH